MVKNKRKIQKSFLDKLQNLSLKTKIIIAIAIIILVSLLSISIIVTISSFSQENIGQQIVKEVEETEEIPFEHKEREDRTIDKGKTEVAQEGSVGEKVVKYRVVYDKNGNESSKEKISEEITKQPLNEVILIGIREEQISIETENNSNSITKIQGKSYCGDNPCEDWDVVNANGKSYDAIGNYSYLYAYTRYDCGLRFETHDGGSKPRLIIKATKDMRARLEDAFGIPRSEREGFYVVDSPEKIDGVLVGGCKPGDGIPLIVVFMKNGQVAYLSMAKLISDFEYQYNNGNYSSYDGYLDIPLFGGTRAKVYMNGVDTGEITVVGEYLGRYYDIGDMLRNTL